MNGTIKRLVTDKGFGFIMGANGGEYFFHHSELRGVTFDGLREGEAVKFTPEKGPKGPRAEDVERA